MSETNSTGRGRHAAETSGEYTETEETQPRNTDVEGEYTGKDDAAPVSADEKGSYVDTSDNTESGPEGEYTDVDE